MRKLPTVYFLLICVLMAPSICAFAQSGDKKRIIVIADFGSKEVPVDFLSTIEKNRALRITVASPAGTKLPAAAEALIKEKRLESALSLVHEPVLPLLYGTKASSSSVIDFSWPEDARDMIFRSQEAYREAWKYVSRGLALRSGTFGRMLVPDMKRFGLKWASFKTTEAPTGVYLQDGFYIIAAHPDTWADTGECFRWINESSGTIVAVQWDGDSALLPQFLNECAQRADMEMMLPKELSQSTDGVLEAVDVLDTGFAGYEKNPVPWSQLSKLRAAVEEYKNSGLAKLKTLDMLHEGLYALYDFETMKKLQDNPQPEDEAAFQAGIKDLYLLLDRTEPGVRVAEIDVSTCAENVSYSAESSSVAFRIINSFSASGTLNVREFGLTLSNDTIDYDIALCEPLPVKPFRVDIYIDMNNHYGAGLTALLPGLDGFVQSENAWEFALRIENDTVNLYRSGRFAPILLNKFKAVKPYSARIPRTTLKGNPLRWWYQVVTSYAPEETPSSGVEDFLCEEDNARQRILKQSPVQLPAIRAE